MNKKMKVAVLGSGNGGCSVAGDFALAGHDVYLCDFEEFSKNIDNINKNDGLKLSGKLEGFVKMAYAGNDFKRTVKDADYVFVVGPAFSTKPFAKASKKYLQEGQKIVICPGSCGGSLVFRNEISDTIDPEKLIIAETSTLPYACRMNSDGSVQVYLKLKGGIFLSTLPKGYEKEVLEEIKDVYDMIVEAEDVTKVMLQNANPVIHPSVTILNSALIERTNGDFLFYEEGVMPCVGRLMKKVDDERIAIGKKLGVDIIPDPELGKMQGYMQEETYEHGYSTANGFKGIKAQSTLEHRYLNEDVGYGLTLMEELGERLGVETPTMTSVINIASAIMDKDYRANRQRTVDSLGLKI
ncbi:MAG: NAD/NADP octopine/nopaline dehydrogenase family protein [Bacillota bacterium]|nr:NAD/NADP octopine/nopaline dehydrogenase family protein [Bacillota bacterium]